MYTVLETVDMQQTIDGVLNGHPAKWQSSKTGVHQTSLPNTTRAGFQVQPLHGYPKLSCCWSKRPSSEDEVGEGIEEGGL